MEDFILTDKDKEQLKKLGIKEEQILWQIEMFRKGTPYVNLVRPCTVGDGIVSLSDEEAKELAKFYEKNSEGLKKIKFVPASGAATRMFKALMRFYNEVDDIKKIKNLAKNGDPDAQDVVKFINNIDRFAFYDDLKNFLKKDGYDIEELIKANRIKNIFEYLLTQKGLNYANVPKALIKFHKYPDGNRTAFEEHLVEATGYVKDNDECYLHFTVSPEHEKRFLIFFQKISNRYEKKYSTEFYVEFSIQDRSTDTIAVDMDNRPFRLKDGSLLFRPGGHGALIHNLNNIDADIIFIKNIDNVVPDRLKEPIYFWKKVLGGYLLKIRDKIYEFIRLLSKEQINKTVLLEAIDFCKRYLYIDMLQGTTIQEMAKYLIDRLNRPLRICGMVKNVEEPGGGPFWVKIDRGNISLQIVESAQVDMKSEEQKKIFNASTHFNPVDIVCCIKDWKGEKFDLRNYVDRNAVFISTKSKDGKEIKALELPGLWNGGMAYWNTIFVEVPFITFNPVKKVVDLLRENHQ